MRVSLHKHEHIEAPIREGGHLASEKVFAQGSESFYPLFNFKKDKSGLAVKMLFR
jgi:hypothetical protein